MLIVLSSVFTYKCSSMEPNAMHQAQIIKIYWAGKCINDTWHKIKLANEFLYIDDKVAWLSGWERDI